jgi:hypothetical protein
MLSAAGGEWFGQKNQLVNTRQSQNYTACNLPSLQSMGRDTEWVGVGRE